MVSEFKGKLKVNNGNWWGETGRYWHDIGVNRVDIGSISRRERTEVRRPAVYLNVNQEPVKTGIYHFCKFQGGFMVRKQTDSETCS
ncbi:hypothetical protein Mal35_50900 [Gimesia maris]|nr:hypothetical protein Mal35_50900 [Gimesia maris]